MPRTRAVSLNRFDPGRRRLLGLRRASPREDGTAPAIVTPVIDPARCNACDACIRICTPGALRSDQAGDGYEIHAAKCTDCRLCVAVCDRAAIELERGAADAGRVRIALYVQRCAVCGTAYRSTRTEPNGTCRFCLRPGPVRGALRLQE